MRENLPRISVITPSYNQATFIEVTIKSVLSQNYPNLEYIVIDGGSSDGTPTLLKKYDKKIFWLSERDKGQSDAINKGLKRTTGDIVCYLNSDDFLEKGALLKVAKFFLLFRQAQWVTGKCKIVDEQGREVRRLVTFYKNIFLKYLRYRSIFQVVQFISQPATFFRRRIIERVGYFDQSLDYDMDFDYWLRIWSEFRLYYLDEYLSSYRVHSLSKAVRSPERQFNSAYSIVRRYTKSNIILSMHKLHSKLALFVYKLLWARR